MWVLIQNVLRNLRNFEPLRYIYFLPSRWRQKSRVVSFVQTICLHLGIERSRLPKLDNWWIFLNQKKFPHHFTHRGYHYVREVHFCVIPWSSLSLLTNDPHKTLPITFVDHCQVRQVPWVRPQCGWLARTITTALPAPAVTTPPPRSTTSTSPPTTSTPGWTWRWRRNPQL